MDKTLVASFITLTITPDATSKDDISPKDMESFLEGPLSMAKAIDGDLIFVSMRKQIELHVRKSRIHVVDLSSRTVADSFAPEAASKTVSLQGGQVTAVDFGYQAEMRVAKKSGEYIAERLLAFERLSALGQLQAKSITLHLSTKTGIFDLTAEPRYGDAENKTIFIAATLHQRVDRPGQATLGSGELKKDFVAGYEQASSFTDQVFRE